MYDWHLLRSYLNPDISLLMSSFGGDALSKKELARMKKLAKAARPIC
jgi:hypothetical protein